MSDSIQELIGGVDVTALVAKAGVLRSRGQANSLHDIEQAADYLDAAADLVRKMQGQIIWRSDAPPTDGSVFYGHTWSPYRWHSYSERSEQRRRGIKGRFQTMNDWGGWENAKPPAEWATKQQIDSLQAEARV